MASAGEPPSSHESHFGGSASYSASGEKASLLSGEKSGGGGGARRLLFQDNDDEDETDLVVSGRVAAETSLSLSKRRSFASRHRGPLGVVMALLVAALVGVVIYFVVNTAQKPAELGPTAGPIVPTTGPVASCADGPGVSLGRRVDCYPEANATATEGDCLARGCCWDGSSPARGGGILGEPACYYPAYYGYRVSTVTNIPGIPNAFQMVLNNNRTRYPSPYPEAIDELRVEVYQETDNRLRIKIVDNKADRYEVPLPLYKRGTSSPVTRKYTVSTSSAGWAFSISVRRSDTTTELFNTSLGALIYSNQFLQISSALPSKYVYGLGEHVGDLLHSVNWTRVTLFARDAFPDDTSWNLYGVQPMYMCVEPDGRTHGVLFRNSNAMDIILSPTPAITYRTTGGVLDFYIFLGPTADNVVQQYTELVGRPFFPPYWALGFHLCRWGYETSAHTMEVVERMRAAKMPYDTQWTDIDYMQNHLDFTIDPDRFAGLPQLVENLHQHQQHYVMIVDPGIANISSYKYYTQGLEQDVFIKDHTGQPIVGKVWPGTTVFVDFTKPSSQDYWTGALQDFYNLVPYDGVWIDMNEPSNFVPGSVNGCPPSSYNTPPYVPAVLDNELYFKTLCMTAQQQASIHYDVHSLYGHTEAVATMSAARSIRGKRSLVISRSTYSGSGNHTGHWLGDNDSTWPDMAESIPGILDFSIFGIPLIGADICGFRDNATEQLCQRWMQLGSFYPFSRNHNIIGTLAQDPAAPRFSEAFRNSTRSALTMRYRLLPYLYTLFFFASSTGSSVARPLFFEYPTDVNTLGIDRQFLWGSDLLISPVLEKNATKVSAYFPASTTWYDIRTGESITGDGTMKTLDAPMDIIPLHVRAGAVLPTQAPNVTTNTSRQNPFGVIVGVGDGGKAFGHLYLDDGDTMDWLTGNKHTIVAFTYTSQPSRVLKTDVRVYGYRGANDMAIRDFTFYGCVLSGNVTAILNHNALPAEFVQYDMDTDVLRVTVPTTQPYRQSIAQDFTLALTEAND
eukprot:scpid29377/ scgid3594/ Lysosomal alpha-glucosidase; Acid maltase